MGFLGRKPSLKEGSSVQLRQHGVVMVEGTVMHVVDSQAVAIKVIWSTTSVYVVGRSYEIDLRPGIWAVL
jgi:hypothetical protein